MPWFPDFVGAVESAGRQTRAAGQADPVGQYFNTEQDKPGQDTLWIAKCVGNIVEPGFWQQPDYEGHQDQGILDRTVNCWRGSGGCPSRAAA